MSTPKDLPESRGNESMPRTAAQSGNTNQNDPGVPVGTDVLLRAKQRLYFVTLIVIALAASLAFVVELVSAEHGDPVQQAVNIPSIALCFGLCLTLTKVHMVPLVERILAVCITLYVLIVDVSNLATNNESMDILLGYDPMVIMACVIIALAAPPRWSQYVTWSFFFIHTALSWAATLQSEQSLSLFWRLQSDLVVAVTVAFISLLTTYSRVLGINRVHSQSLQQLALTDQLTQLPNRRALSETLEQNPFASVVLIDIDNFKKLNDVYGHARGDDALQQVAVVLHDVFADSGTVGRWGGEEFLTVVPQGTVRQGHALAESARLRITSLEFEPRITVSMGVTVHHPGEDVKVAIDRADTLLYKAKSEGKNRVAVDPNRAFSPSKLSQKFVAQDSLESTTVASVIDTAVTASRKVRPRQTQQATWIQDSEPNTPVPPQPRVVDLAQANKTTPRQAGNAPKTDLAEDLLGPKPTSDKAAKPTSAQPPEGNAHADYFQI